MQDPLYRPNYYAGLQEFRELTSKRVKRFVTQKFFSVFDYARDPLKFQAALESLSFCDYSLAIKSGVHFTLCGGTIVKLGTERHHEEFLPKMDTLELPGCFGMTELGHGSNVMGIETTATYDQSSDSFIIHTPNNEASKFWIGGAGSTAKICAVFAQLTIHGSWEGPHVFIVRLRDDCGNIMPGVRILDNGPKQGLNGVDNGQIWFDHVRVPRHALLDRFASVDDQGNYSSPIPNPAQRFGTMVSGLTTGRMLIAQAAVDAMKVGVTIALKYSAMRPQFGDSPIVAYITQQRRLLPALATAYAMHLSLAKCKELAMTGGGKSVSHADANIAKQVHVLSSGLKAAATWHRVHVLQDCRECCGGMGFLAINKIGPMLNDMNVDVTFEGDNTVMMQQVAKPLVDATIKSKHISVPSGPKSINPERLGDKCIASLLAWRRDALAAEIAQDVSAAAMQGGSRAAAQAFENNLDRVVRLGWASVDSSTYDIFLNEIESAPAEWQGQLRVLQQLYGLYRIEQGIETYLQYGALDGRHVAGLRAQIHGACSKLAENDAHPAQSLCKGFGIPDHLLQAPIALGSWRDIGASVGA
jgi:acyl-CoA oxidase